MLITTKSFYLLSYIMVLIVDVIIETYFKDTKFYHKYTQFFNRYDFFTLGFILFVVIFILITLFNFIFDITIIKVYSETYDINLIDYATSENRSTTDNFSKNETILYSNKIENTVNINGPHVTISVPVITLNNIIVAASSSGGAALAYKLGRKIGGSPALKIIGGLSIIGGVQIGTSLTANALCYITGEETINNYSDNNQVNKYIFLLLNNYTNKGINFMNDGFGDLLIQKYSEHPLSILFELNRLINIEIIFMFMLLNIFLIKKINNIDFKSYLPKNKAGQIILYIINRYIKTWSSISKYIIYLAIGMIIYSVILSKLAMILISIA